PGLNGYEVTALLRPRDGFRESIFIAISGYGQEHDRERSRASGFDHHLAKPVDFERLLELIDASRQ
ncbi:response regulator, partial [Singulisphaera rosea]